MSASNSITPFVPDYRPFTTDSPSVLKSDLVQSYQDLAAGINNRTVSIYTGDSTLTGNKLYGLGSRLYMTYRVMLSVDSILNGTTTVAHGITNTTEIRYLSILGAATSSSGALPLPYVNVGTPADGIQVSISGANLVLTTTTANYTGYSALIVIEYARPGQQLSPS